MSIERIREALAAGPTPGEWACYDDSSDGKTNRIEIAAIGKTVARIYRSVQEQDLPNARLIAACSPANMTAILAHVDAQAAENEQLREMLARLYAGSDLYCDDGELQDARAEPFIDFKRDSVADIRCAMVERNERKEQR